LLTQGVRHADGLAKQGRFSEARDAYVQLIRQLHQGIAEVKREGKAVGPGTLKTLKALEQRLGAIQEKKAAHEKEHPSLVLRAVRQRLQQAEQYTRRSLFSEALLHYQAAIERIATWKKALPENRHESAQACEISLNLLRTRIIQYSSAGKTPEPRKNTSSLPTPADRLQQDDHIILCLGGALLETTGVVEALNALEQTDSLPKPVLPVSAQLAELLAREGEPRLSADLYRRILKTGFIERSEQPTLLQGLAAAYEQMEDRRNALRTYNELLALDRAHTLALQRSQELRKDLRKFRLTIATVTEHPRFFFTLALLIAVAFMAFAPAAKTVDNVDYFTVENDPDIEYYGEFKKVFGSDEFFVIAFRKPEGIFTTETLQLLDDLTYDLEGLEEAEDVTSLANVDDIIGEEDYFEVREFLEDIPEDPADLEQIREQATQNPLYVKNLISEDGTTAAIMIEAFDRPEDEGYRKRLITEAQEVLDTYRDRVDTFHLAGWTYTNLSLSRCVQKDVSTFIPVSYFFIALAIWLVFRNLILTGLGFANILVCVGSVMGLFGLTGITLNNVTAIIPSMVMALALCDTVHIFSHMERRVLTESGGDRRIALAHVLKRVVVPSALTSLTTAIGFLSLAVSEIPPIRDFAWIASAGMVFEFLFSFFFLPPLLLLFKPERIFQQYETKSGLAALLHRNYRLVSRIPFAIVFLGLVLTLAAGWYASSVKVETNLVGFFKEHLPIRKSLDFVETHLGGVDSLDVSLHSDTLDAFKDPENLKVIEAIQEHVKSLQGVDKAVSFVDFLKDMNESFHNEDPAFYRIPESRDMVAQYLLLYDAEDIEDVINNTYDHARIGLRIALHKSSEQARLVREIENFVQRIDNKGLNIRVTGRALKEVKTIDALVDGQIYSLSLATAIITLVMFFALRSLALGFLSMVPNIFPIVINFGIMGALGIALDTGTALIAAVAIGIAVDDTIHFLSEYKERRSLRMPIPRAVQAVLFLKGRALMSSSIILAIGFSVLVLSSFQPTMNFGFLTAIIMITALIGDAFFLPAIIMLKDRR
jgi:predicted RND superfamily exporter protein